VDNLVGTDFPEGTTHELIPLYAGPVTKRFITPPESEDWICTLNALITEARQLLKPRRKHRKNLDDTLLDGNLWCNGPSSGLGSFREGESMWHENTPPHKKVSRRKVLKYIKAHGLTARELREWEEAQ
jgi:hypothetical protein